MKLSIILGSCFYVILTIVLIALNLLNIVDLSWTQSLCPIWIPVLLFVAVFILGSIAEIFKIS